MNCILLGSNSDIGRELEKRLTADGWNVWGWKRGDSLEGVPNWDLVVCAIGTLKPVGKFFEVPWVDWIQGFSSNVMVPLRLIRALYPLRNEGASICFFGGTNPFKVNPRYTAYSTSKAALRMAVRDIAGEEDLRVFMLDTGYVPTKIHVEPNDRKDCTTHEQIYKALTKCLRSPKANVSGFYFYVPDIAP